MPRLRNSIKIDASPEEVWAVLGDLAAVTEWVPGIVSASVEGSKRVCTTAEGGGEIHEEISGYSAERRSYRYTQTKVALPVKTSRGRLAVEAQGSGSLVVWDAEFDVLDPAREAEVTRMIDGAYRQTLESLRRRLE